MRRSTRATLSITLMIFCVCCPSFAQKLPAAAAPQANSDEAVIQRFFAAWNSHNADKVAASFSPDGVYEDVTAGHVSRGRTEIRQWALGGLDMVGNFKLVAQSTSFHNGRGTVEWVWSGTDKGIAKTGKSFSVRGVSVIEIKKGQIVNYKEFYDYASIMNQLGMLPAQIK